MELEIWTPKLREKNDRLIGQIELLLSLYLSPQFSELDARLRLDKTPFAPHLIIR